MSTLRFNEKAIIAYAAMKKDCLIRGQLKKLSKSKPKHIWVVIKSNMLFIYKTSKEPPEDEAAHRCYVLENCFPELTESGFRIVFHEHKTYFLSFLCSSSMADAWVESVKIANFKYLRNNLQYYQSLISSFESKRVSRSSFEMLCFIFKVQGLNIPQNEVDIHIEVFNENEEIVLDTGNYCYDPYETVFPECLFIKESSNLNNFEVRIYRTNTVYKRQVDICIGIVECNINDILYSSVDGKHGKQHIMLPLDSSKNTDGMLIVTCFSLEQELMKTAKQSNHRSSCLFSESIQPLSLTEKDTLFSQIFTSSEVRKFSFNNLKGTISESNEQLKVLHESCFRLSNTSEIAICFLQFLLKDDISVSTIIGKLSGGEASSIAVDTLKHRIDVNRQHKKCLEELVKPFRRSHSLKGSGYQTLYTPSHIFTYRVKIMESCRELYEIYDKVIMSTPTKRTDRYNEPGLYSMFCNESLKTSFNVSKSLTITKDKLIMFQAEVHGTIELLAKALANSSLDQVARYFSSFEALILNIMDICSKSQVADLVLDLAKVLGPDSDSPLYVWINDDIVIIDTTWSVASAKRDILNQLDDLVANYTRLMNDYSSDLWVQLLFIPCHKLERNTNSLLVSCISAIEYRIHMLQNTTTTMNRLVMRLDAVMSQLVTGLITCLYSSIYTYMDDVFFWLQMLNVGFICQLESVLSCNGLQRSMLEDTFIAVEVLRSYRVEIVCKDTVTCGPTFTGSRHNLLITVPVPPNIYALILDISQGQLNRKIQVVPLLCNQTIWKGDYEKYSSTEVEFVRTINTKSMDYIQKIVTRNHIFYQSLDDPERIAQITACISCLLSLYSEHINAPQIIFPKFQALGKLLCAGQICMSGNGIDDGVMATTLNLTQHLVTNYHLEHEQVLLDCLRQGSLLDRCSPAASSSTSSQQLSNNLFSYNVDITANLYPEYKPPVTTCY